MSKPGFGVRWQSDNPYSETGEPDPHAEADMLLAKLVHRKLMEFFFHPDWETAASYRQGIVKFKLRSLMGPNNWMVIHITDLEADPSFRLVKRYAGEALERYRIPRTTGFSEAEFAAAVQRNPLGHLAGQAVPE